MSVCIATTRLVAAPPELPDWQYGASVYGPQSHATASDTVTTPAAPPLSADAQSTASQGKPAKSPIVHAAHREVLPHPAKQNDRRLAPIAVDSQQPSNEVKPLGTSTPLSRFALPTGTVYTTMTGLALVVGLFLLCMWLLRRGTRRPSAMLPAEVASVIGRVPLYGRQFGELLRIGNKLVLVAMTPAGVEPLTEVTDPAEVNRLLGLCQQYDPHSTTKAFEDVFRQLSRDPAPADLYAQDPSFGMALPPEPAYRALRREVRNA